MKKKILFGVTISLFAVMSIINVNIFKHSDFSNFTLDLISAKAVDTIEQLPSIIYNPTYYPITGSWCCFEGTKGCVPYNCKY